ncbi:ABC transporter ATP-binding protein/permease [Acidimicrobiia bacterium]|nr:ABC transporter ATP-binding protein/permease [Acidimicrobiia bacterium]
MSKNKKFGNLRKSYEDIIFVSKLTKTNKKKLTIFTAVVTANLIALMDILLIVSFTAIITNETRFGNFQLLYVEFLLENLWVLPLIVVIRYFCIYFQALIEKIMVLNIQKNLKLHILEEIFEKRNYSTADAYFYIDNVTGHIAFFYTALITFANSIIQSFGFVAYLYFSNRESLGTFFIGAVVLYVPSKFFVRKSREFMHRAYNVAQQTSGEVQKIIDNTFLIRVLKQDKEEMKNFDRIYTKYNTLMLANHKYGAVNSFIPSLLTTFIFSILLAFFNFASVLTIDFIGVTLRLFQSLGAITGSINRIVNSQVHIEKFYLMQKNTNAVNQKNYIFFDSFKDNEPNAVLIEDASFRYFNSDKEIFEKLNITFQKDKHTIITGANGSGKSTLLALISGVLYPQSGKVITSTSKIGYIGATPLILTDTIKSNVLYGNKLSVTDDEILNLLKSFELFDDENRYSLDQQISNKSLSSGQMQKIAFVRALLAKVELLLLDESTANLDDKTRNKIFNILDKQNITIINSTHDPKMFKNVDFNYNIIFENDIRHIKKISL